jgi:ketosteroid isomerase-like protein
MTDQQQIRDLIQRWMDISGTDQVEPLGELMSDDIVFLQPGQPPLRGRDAAMTVFRQAANKVRLTCWADIQDIAVSG